MAYVLFAHSRPKLPAWLFPCLLLVLGIFFLHFSAVPAGWLICLALGIALPHFQQVGFTPIQRLSHEIAKYSYGIYLSHMFALGFVFKTLALHSLAAQIALTVAITATSSVLGYHLVEHPLIRLGARLAATAEKRYEQHEAVSP